MWMQKKAAEILNDLKGTSIFLVGKHHHDHYHPFWSSSYEACLHRFLSKNQELASVIHRDELHHEN